MEESFSIPPEECGDSELDPRIQLELEKLNTATAEINRLELELDESNTTFRMLLNEATRRLKGLAARLGNSVERARPYHEAANAAASARAACQRAAVQYQRASEIHAAAKETVALAEQRFKSNQHEQWQFDNAWQEMLNHATIKVMDAESQKAESGREHMKRAQLFNAAETKLQHMEEQQRKHIAKSRPYFEEKQLCQEQLATQKSRIEQLQGEVGRAKAGYARALRALEDISEEIHRKRRNLYGDNEECPVGPREPGVGAEREVDYSLESERHEQDMRHPESALEREEECGAGGGLEELRRRVRRLAARPLEAGGSHGDSSWEEELNSTVERLDQMLLAREQEARNRQKRMLTVSQSAHSSRDKLSDPYSSAVLRSHSSHDPSQLLRHSDIALSQDQASEHPAPAPAQNALSQKSELFFSQPDISSSHNLFPKLSNLSTNPPEFSSSQSSYDNSLEINCEPSLDSLDSYAAENPKDVKVSLQEMSKLQLCLSVSTLEDLLPAGSKDLPIIQSIGKTAKDSADDTKHVPFSYKVTFDDFQPSPSKSNQGQRVESNTSSSENEKPFQNLKTFQGSNQSLEAVSDVASEDGSVIKSTEMDLVTSAVLQPEVKVSKREWAAVEVMPGAQHDTV